MTHLRQRMIEDMGIRSLPIILNQPNCNSLSPMHFCMKQAIVFKPFSISCFFIEILEGARLKQL